jgi:CubicO group peptidase (beta-lactamase class C family)
MSFLRSWFEQEQQDKQIILEKFWNQCVLNPDEKRREQAINGIKDHFLLALPEPGISQNDWITKVNSAWKDPSTFTNKEKFFGFFTHISSLKAVGVAEGLISSPKAKEEAVNITDNEKNALKQYTEDRNITVSVIAGSVKTNNILPLCSENYTTSDVFTTQSVSKVFTGVLALRMLEEGIITERDLNTPSMQIEKSVENLLAEKAPRVLDQMRKVTLHQAMTHHAGLGVGEGVGFGDYYSDYINKVEKARAENRDAPAIKKLEDFIQFIPNQTTSPGTIGECDLLFMSYSPLGTNILTLNKPTYILSPEGLYYVSNSDNKISSDNLIPLDSQKVTVDNLWAQLAGQITPYNGTVEKLTPEQQNLITTKTGHLPVGITNNYKYSNSSIILTALSLEYLYNKNRNKELEPNPLDFNAIMKKYVTGHNAANMSCFEPSSKGLKLKFNPADLNAEHMVGSPGGGYLSTAEDLAKFAAWMHDKCQQPEFVKLIEKYGQEFCPYPTSKTIEHTGDGPSNSAFFSLNWGTGNLVIVLNDQRAIAASEVGREIKDHILSQKGEEYKTELSLPRPADSSSRSSTAFIINSGFNLTTPNVKPSQAAASLPKSSYPLGKQNNMSTQERVMMIDENQIKETMKKENADISGVTIAFIGDKGTISTKQMGVTGKDSTTPVTPETVFGAASLSKPVFAYLVLKLIEANNSSTNKNNIEAGKFTAPFDLDTPLNDILPLEEASLTLGLGGLSNQLNEKLGKTDKELGGLLTARMVLSHRTGLPIVHGEKDGPLKFQFEPNTEYGYSGVGYAYLQKVIEKLTNSNLEKLAKEHVFVPLEMSDNTSFIADKSRPQVTQAANSLQTTASDYARFIRACMEDRDLFKPACTSTGAVLNMTNDDWATKVKVPLDDLKHVARSLIWGLQIDDDGKPIRAYHTGDMSENRAFVAMNLENKTAIVYFANSHNGHILADQIISPNIELKNALNCFSQQYGFAVKFEDNWQTLENERGERIGAYLKSRNNPADKPVALVQQQSEEKKDVKTLEKQQEIGTPASEPDENTQTVYKSPTPLSLSTKLTRDH